MLEKMKQATGFCLQYGCGLSAPAGWLNYDASPTLRLQRLPLGLGRIVANFLSPRFPDSVIYGDVTQGLPVADESCRVVYCSHVLEHLSLNDMRRALRETLRILQPGGVFRLVVPDLEQCIQNYCGDDTANAANRFMRSTGLGKETRSKGLSAFLREWLGNSQHLWLWDEKALIKELEDAGFVSCRRAFFGDSSEPAFRAVEDESRWNGSLGLECQKPE